MKLTTILFFIASLIRTTVISATSDSATIPLANGFSQFDAMQPSLSQQLVESKEEKHAAPLNESARFKKIAILTTAFLRIQGSDHPGKEQLLGKISQAMHHITMPDHDIQNDSTTALIQQHAMQQPLVISMLKLMSTPRTTASAIYPSGRRIEACIWPKELGNYRQHFVTLRAFKSVEESDPHGGTIPEPMTGSWDLLFKSLQKNIENPYGLHLHTIGDTTFSLIVYQQRDPSKTVQLLFELPMANLLGLYAFSEYEFQVKLLSDGYHLVQRQEKPHCSIM